MDRTGHPEAEAWHEAGHAVVARLLGGRVRWLSLEAEDAALEGQAAIEWRARDARELASLSGRTALGGPLAELSFRGEHELEDPRLIAAWDADWSEAERQAAILEPDGEQRPARLHRWIDADRALVTAPAVAERIARVADALDAHGSIDE